MNSFCSTFCRWKRELSDQFQTVVSRHPAIEFAFQLLIPGLPMFPENKHDDVFGGLLGRSESRALSRWACGLSGQRNRGVHQSQHKEYSMAELPLERVGPKLWHLGPQSPSCTWPLHSVEKSPSGESGYELNCK
jgi:hypothetical protein